MRLIGLNGRLHSGKDTAVQFIREATSLRVTRAAFADKLKLSAVRALGFTDMDVADAVSFCNLLKESGQIVTYVRVQDSDQFDVLDSKVIEGREFLQLFGTEAHRDVFGFDFWVDALLPRPSDHVAPGVRIANANAKLHMGFPDTDVLVVTDVRFPNEAERIFDLGGEIWYINADARLGPLPEEVHASELPLPSDLITITLYNNSTLDSFRRGIKRSFLGVVHD
jgi:hypothetical protein